MPTLGNKHECFKCEVKFYDLGRSEVVCPSCGTNQAEADAGDEVEEAPVVDEPPAEKETGSQEDASDDAADDAAEAADAGADDESAESNDEDEESDELFEGEEEEEEDLFDDD